MIKNIALLKGGNSPEAEVSRLSADSVKKALLEIGYNVNAIEVDDSFLDWAIKNKNNIDVFFNALHGSWGEDGKIQGFLEYLKIPYTHSGVLSSAVGMNKDLSKKIFKNHGLPVPKGEILSQALLDRDTVRYKKPFVIKPISEGSSLDVHIIKSSSDFTKLVKNINLHKYLIEDFIEGTDLTVGVIGGKAIGLLEIETEENFYDYHAKYNSSKTLYKKPKNLSSDIINQILRYSEKANDIINCTGVTRIDFRLDGSKGIEGIHLLEINTQPGLTKNSLLPKIAKNSGIKFNQLIQWIVKDAGINK